MCLSFCASRSRPFTSGATKARVPTPTDSASTCATTPAQFASGWTGSAGTHEPEALGATGRGECAAEAMDRQAATSVVQTPRIRPPLDLSCKTPCSGLLGFLRRCCSPAAAVCQRRYSASIGRGVGQQRFVGRSPIRAVNLCLPAAPALPRGRFFSRRRQSSQLAVADRGQRGCGRGVGWRSALRPSGLGHSRND